MGKSIRSKTKRTFRAKKREDSVYAAVHAARLNRLHKKLRDITLDDGPEGEDDVEEVSEFEDEKDGMMEAGRAPQDDQMAVEGAPAEDAMELDSGAGPSDTSKRISTHGPRSSRRQAWRNAKGLAANPKSKKTNRQGMPVGKRKAGRPQRRR